MMRVIPPAIAVIVAFLAVRCSAGHAQLSQHIAPVAKPWSPTKTSLSKEWIDTVTFLQAHGLGDPRGGEYRKAKIQMGSVWQGDGGIVEQSGWFMPDNTFLTWEGLYYKPVQILGKANLEQDVQNAASGNKAPGRDFVFYPRIVGPNTPVGICLLLIAGRADLAETLGSTKGRVGNDNLLTGAATQFLSAWFDRAVTAHMRGDDKLAASDAGTLVALLPAYNELEKPSSSDSQYRHFSFLDPILALEQDSERRLNEGAKSKRADRIAELIQNLDEVKARQMGQPGGVYLAEDPIVADLIKQGDPAVGPLLDCMENDHRLTRSVSFGRDFFPSRNLISVKSAAFAAFCGIVDSYEFRKPDYEAFSVDDLRKWWAANKGKTNPERWMSVLADDNAGYQRWEEAASRMVQDSSIINLGRGATLGDLQAKPSAMKGEPVRGKTNPSVTDLLAKRAQQLVEPGDQPDSNRLFEAASGARIARILARWDPERALPIVRKVSDRCQQILNGPAASQGAAGILGPAYPLLETARLDLGDASGIDAYAAWISQIDPVTMFGFSIQAMSPLWSHPETTETSLAYTKIFRSPDSKWNLQSEVANPRYAMALTDYAGTVMLRIPAFREDVVRLLDDQRAPGEVWVEGGSGRFMIPKGASGGMRYRVKQHPDPLAKDTKHRPYRIADMVASALTALPSIPDFAAYWPQVNKDRAIAQMKQILQSHGAEAAKQAELPPGWNY